MINNPRKVKDLIKNLAQGDSENCQLLQRRYAMERFLERMAESKYKQNLILKGGMLIASMLDVGQRMTRDTDMTMQDMTLDLNVAVSMVGQIAAISLDDGVVFEIENAFEIMEDAEYNGVRIEIRAYLDKTEIPIKIDISTGDTLTPSAIEYNYELLLEDRSIEIFAYNIETVLAEKIETILSRSIFNTRMRDFYDVWALSNTVQDIDFKVLAKAVKATIKTRDHGVDFGLFEEIIDELLASKIMLSHWTKYQSKNAFAQELSWQDALHAVSQLCTKSYELT